MSSSASGSTKPPLVIGIAGGTGSGKTTVAKKLRDGLPGRCLLIEFDAYYRDRSDLSFEERKRLNYDHPEALESELLAEHLRDLRAGRSVDIPVYDFVTHLRRKETWRAEPAPVIIVEGILVLVEHDVREKLDIKIFVDTDADLRVFRRVRRDLEERGRTFASVRDQYYSTVRPMHIQHVEPSKRWADLIVPEGGENKVALDVLLAKLQGVAFGA